MQPGRFLPYLRKISSLNLVLFEQIFCEGMTSLKGQLFAVCIKEENYKFLCVVGFHYQLALLCPH